MDFPKIFHFIWIGGKTMPVSFKENMETWKSFHPNWEFRLWNDPDQLKFINRSTFDKYNRIGWQVDIMRYEIIYQFGGIYADLDTVCLVNFEEIVFPQIPEIAKVFVGRERRNSICNAIIGAVANVNVFRKIIDDLPTSIELAKEKYGTRIKSIYEGSGPIFFTKHMENNPEVHCFPTTAFNHTGLSFYVGKNKIFAQHQFSGSWKLL